MKRLAFDTGKAHQSAIAAWARSRIVDDGGKRFDDDQGEAPWQWGCVLADGVGLGKTWEALAATALILDKASWWGHSGKKSERKRRRAGRVLILVPPGLVSKWIRELTDPKGFTSFLQKWTRQTKRREFIRDTFAPESIFELKTRRSLDDLPSGKMKRRRYELPDGVYVCNWNVFLGAVSKGRDRVGALRNQEWDVVIVDEAHHLQARKALEKLSRWVKLLLLSATPFQLDPTELHALTKHTMDSKTSHRILERGAVREYVDLVDAFFKNAGDAPTKLQRVSAERVLGQVVARSRVKGDGRHNFTIDANGKAWSIRSPAELGETDIPAVLEASIRPPKEFEAWYLERRLALAAREADDEPAHVAIELRKLLSTRMRAKSDIAPRVTALQRWATTAIERDLLAFVTDGIPRKILVFTSFVDKAALELRDVLHAAFTDALKRVRRNTDWAAMRLRATAGLNKVFDELAKQCGELSDYSKPLGKLRKNLMSSPYCDLFGQPRFVRRAIKELVDRIVALSDTREFTSDQRLERAQQRTRQRTGRAILDAIAMVSISATYTGADDSREREANGEAFRSVFAPWILVASNVGSEGIDLHTYSQHLVHFDLEWNPARMEQREGRIDRLGRQLKSPVSIYYLLVRGTYDERMFHQLIARRRWHSVLLGRSGNRLVNRDEEARMLTQAQAENISLDLRPRW